MKLKWSRYVTETLIDEGPDKRNVIFFNSVNRGVYQTDMESKKKIEDSMQDTKMCPDDEKDVIAKLYKDGFIVGKEIDETEKFDQYRRDYFNDIFGMVVYFTPTWNCNFSCPYCIQNSTDHNMAGRSPTMDDSTISACVDWMLGFMEKNKESILGNSKRNSKAKTLRTVFFGGEPTLAHSANMKLLGEIHRKKPDWIGFESSMISNGYIFDEKMICDYKRYHFSSVQITLDGPPAVHDSRRKTVSGDKTFETILNNIKLLCSLRVEVAVRINVDDSNITYVTDLIDLLAENDLNKEVILSIAPVDSWSGAAFPNGGHTAETLSHINSIYGKAKERGFQLSMWESFCAVYAKSFFSIAPDGKLYKCPSLCGEQGQCVGSVFEESLNEIYDKFLKIDMSSRCKLCRYAGVCGGGCYYQKYLSDFRDHSACLYSTLKEYVEAYSRYSHVEL